MNKEARYINVYEKKGLMVCKAYDGDDGHWLLEHEVIAVVESEYGILKSIPVQSLEYLEGFEAKELLKESIKDGTCVLMEENCPFRDSYIKENLNEWIGNEGCVSDSNSTKSLCTVVALLAKYGMWKDEYADSIDLAKIRSEYGEV